MNIRKLSMSELNRLSTEEFRTSVKLPVVVVLDNIRSQNNTGSVFRTSDAFLIKGIYLCGITATPPHREIHKTALGAENTVKWEYFADTSDAIRKLKDSGYRIIAMEHTNTSRDLQDLFVVPENPLAVIFGNEINGIQDKVLSLADECLEVPQFGTKHSINVAIAAGITLWELHKKFKNIG